MTQQTPLNDSQQMASSQPTMKQQRSMNVESQQMRMSSQPTITQQTPLNDWRIPPTSNVESQRRRMSSQPDLIQQRYLNEQQQKAIKKIAEGTFCFLICL